MEDTYLTISSVSEGYYTEKRSKFYAFAHHVETPEEVRELQQFYKKKYYDARHVCYAYRLGSDGSIFRANDDGEPSSTAGKPIHGALLSANLTNVVIFVIRYYGGVNLGTGGLIVAYREAAHDAMGSALELMLYIPMKTLMEHYWPKTYEKKNQDSLRMNPSQKTLSPYCLRSYQEVQRLSSGQIL